MGRVIRAILLITALASSRAWAAEWPDPNPAPNPDGTWTWYVGNDTQYPVIQDVLDACGDGDDIVVAAGLYVQSLVIDSNDITLRPSCTDMGQWASVVFWNPTEGFENDNRYAIRLNGAANTYVGRPRQLVQLPNEYIEEATVIPGEWDPAGPPIPVADVSDATPGAAMTFWSRSIDDVAIFSENCAATIQDCLMTSSAGFGGGVMCTGPANSIQFIDCIFTGMYAGGQGYALNDEPVCVITVAGGSPAFHRCVIIENDAGAAGVIRLKDSASSWYDTRIEDNRTLAGVGTVYGTDATPVFSKCSFVDNESREGTLYFETNGLLPPSEIQFNECNFELNMTSGSQYGGVLIAECDTCAGEPPRVSLSRCGFDGNNGNLGLGLYDIETPWFPEYRIAMDLSLNGLITLDVPGSVMGDVNSDGFVDDQDLDLLMSMLGTCQYDGNGDGVIQIDDLLEFISQYGTTCQ